MTFVKKALFLSLFTGLALYGQYFDSYEAASRAGVSPSERIIMRRPDIEELLNQAKAYLQAGEEDKAKMRFEDCLAIITKNLDTALIQIKCTEELYELYKHTPEAPKYASDIMNAYAKALPFAKKENREIEKQIEKIRSQAHKEGYYNDLEGNLHVVPSLSQKAQMVMADVQNRMSMVGNRIEITARPPHLSIAPQGCLEDEIKAFNESLRITTSPEANFQANYTMAREYLNNGDFKRAAQYAHKAFDLAKQIQETSKTSKSILDLEAAQQLKTLITNMRDQALVQHNSIMHRLFGTSRPKAI